MRICTCSAPCKHVWAPKTLRITVHLSREQDYRKKPSLHRAPPVHGSPPGPGAKVDFSESRFRSKRLSDCKADASRCSEMHSFAFLAPCIAPSILAPWLREEREICNGRSNKGHYRKCGSQTWGGREVWCFWDAFIWEVWEMSSHISGRSRMSLG